MGRLTINTMRVRNMKKLNTKIDFVSAILLLGLATAWGGSFFFAEVAMKELPPLTVTLHRVFWAVPILFIIIKFKRIILPNSFHVWCRYLVMGALNNAIPFSLIFWAQTNIGSGLAAILNSTTAVFGALIAGILLVDEQLTFKKVLGALIAVVGVAVILGINAIKDLNITNLSQIAVLCAAVSYSLASVWGKKYLSEYPPLVNAFGMLSGGTLIMVPIVLYIDGIPSLAIPAYIGMSLFSLVIISTVIAYLLFFEILRRAGAANLMLVTLLIPPIAVVLSSLFLDEKFENTAWIGFLIIAVGLLITDGRLIEKIKLKDQ